GALYFGSGKAAKAPVGASVILYADGSRLARVGATKVEGATGAGGLIVTGGGDELAAHGISLSDLRTEGYKVRTTVDPKAQRDAEDAVVAKLKGQQPHLGAALVAVRPGTGEVIAYYGGSDSGSDLAASPHPPGSSFAVYPLAAALENGISVKSLWD